MLALQARANQVARWQPRRMFARSGVPVVSPAALPDTVMLEKLRATTFEEFAVYVPITADGIKWGRWLYSNRFFGAGAGLELIATTLAYLYASTTLALFSATGTGGITAGTPTATVAGASATTRTGTWTGPVTVASIANTYWTATTGDLVTYTITVPAGGTIYHEAPAVGSNGGIGEVVIRLSGVEISAGEYLCPLSSGVRITDYTAPNNTLAIKPLAKVTAGGTYTVTLTRSAQSAASGRLYDTRVRAFDPIPYNGVGWWGDNIVNSGVASTNANLSYAAGVTAVYELTNCTRIGFRFGQLSTGGQVAFKVYDSGGAEIATYVNTTAEMWKTGASQISEVIVAEGLAKGTYYLHATVLATRNASSTGYRFYSFGPRAYDQTTAGTVGTDAFDILDMPAIPATSGDVGTHVLLGPGNLDYATEWRSAGSSAGAQGFVGGVHGSETIGALTVTVNGAAVDYAAGAIGAKWTGARVEIAYASTVQTPDNATAFGTLARAWRWSREGWRSALTMTLTADAVQHTNYILMQQGPNGGDTRSDGVGALNTIWTDQTVDEVVADQSDNSNTVTAPRRAFAAVGPAYAVQSVLTGCDVAVASVLIRDLTSFQVKGYVLSDADGTNGTPRAAGYSEATVKEWRVIEGAYV